MWNYKNLENDKGRSYRGRKRSIRNSNKTLWEIDREIKLGLDFEALQKACLLRTARIIGKCAIWNEKKQLQHLI